jgi:hypothetical protein
MMKIQALRISKKRYPRGMQKAHRARQNTSYKEVGAHFLANHVDVRFTPAHAREAGYYLRKGEGMLFGSKPFWRSYSGRKFKKFGHMNPLQFTGASRQRAKVGATSRASSQGVRIPFPALRVFNFRHPQSRIQMNHEFRRITRREAIRLSIVFGTTYNGLLNNQPTATIIERVG